MQFWYRKETSAADVAAYKFDRVLSCETSKDVAGPPDCFLLASHPLSYLVFVLPRVSVSVRSEWMRRVSVAASVSILSSALMLATGGHKFVSNLHSSCTRFRALNERPIKYLNRHSHTGGGCFYARLFALFVFYRVDLSNYTWMNFCTGNCPSLSFPFPV